MSVPSTIRRDRLGTRVVAALTLVVALVSSSCSTGGQSGNEAAPKKSVKVKSVDRIAKQVPKNLRKKGTITLATNAPSAPMAFYGEDNKTLRGFDIDIGNALGEVLGLKVQWKNVSFDSIIPGLQAGRYDAGISRFSIERERLQVMNFVSYFLTGGSFMVKKGSGIKVNDFDELCGYRVAVLKGISQVENLQEADRGCKARGKKPITIMQIPDQNSVVLALSSGRADVVSADKPQIEYAAGRSAGKLCVSGTYRTIHSITGIAVPKKSTALNRPLQLAVDELVRSGAYEKIWKRWGFPKKGSRGQISAEYTKLAKPWGVGSDGVLRKSRVFTKPAEIRTGHQIFPMPLQKGCA